MRSVRTGPGVAGRLVKGRAPSSHTAPLCGPKRPDPGFLCLWLQVSLAPAPARMDPSYATLRPMFGAQGHWVG